MQRNVGTRTTASDEGVGSANSLSERQSNTAAL